MKIIYKDTKVFTKQQLEDLFVSVAWESGNYPELLVDAMKGYGSVFSAWHEDALVGLASTMDDGCMTAYTHYVLVNPKYQGHHIGQELMERVKQKYKNYNTIVLNASVGKKEFYQKCGFSEDCSQTPMALKLK